MMEMCRIVSILLTATFCIQHFVESATDINQRKQDDEDSRAKVSQANGLTPRIIGGFNTAPGRYPYYTGLWYAKEKVINCGGSLIAPDVVLTAAHCFSPKIPYVAQVGRYNLGNPKDSFEPFEVVKYLPYPFFGVDNIYSGDFMLLFLNGTSSTPPLKINHEEIVPQTGQNITVVGLGADSAGFFSTAFPSILQQVTLNAVTNDACERATDGIRSNKGFISKDSLCVWSAEKSYCYGDSGGPLFIQGSSPDEDVQVGVVSWSRGCYKPNFPDVSARVSEAAEWIDQNVCRYSKDPPAWFDCGNRTFPPEPTLPTNPFLPGKTYPVTVEIELDSAPYETWWFILNATGHLVYIVPRYTYTRNYTRTKVEQVVHLPIGQSYTFVIKDIGEDGLFGSYKVRLGTKRDGEILVSNEYFYGTENRTSFNLSSSITPAPTLSPTRSQAPSISPAPTLPVRAVTLTINFGYSYRASYFGYRFLNSAGEEVSGVPIGAFGYDNITVETTVHLPKDAYYTFVFRSDGTSLYPGNYTLVLGPPDAGGPVLIYSNGTFGAFIDGNTSSFSPEERTRFFLPNSFTSVPSVAPSQYPSLTPTITPRPTGPLQALTLTINFAYHDPYNFGYALLNSRNRTIINETAGTFADDSETAQKILHVPSDEQYTFILSNQEGYVLIPGNYSIAAGLPGDRGPILAPTDNKFTTIGANTSSNDDFVSFVFSTVVTTATFVVPSTFSSPPSRAPTPSSPITLFIDFAGYPSEIGFSISNEFQEQIAEVPIGTFGLANKTFERVFDLSTGLKYTFVISDYFGDGVFPGKFSLIIGTPGSGGPTIVSKAGIKGFKEEYNFTLTMGAASALPLRVPSSKPMRTPLTSVAPSAGGVFGSVVSLHNNALANATFSHIPPAPSATPITQDKLSRANTKIPHVRHVPSPKVSARKGNKGGGASVNTTKDNYEAGKEKTRYKVHNKKNRSLP